MAPTADSLRHSANLPTSLAQAYKLRVEHGEIETDLSQSNLINRLDELIVDLQQNRLAHKSSALGWLFSKNQPAEQFGPKGVYIWGDVGRGKSMLMDMFFELAPNSRKKRVHFHDFMQDIHARIHSQRQKFKAGQSDRSDPIPPIAETLAREVRLLCFDEFSVTDVADAMILSRLFSLLFNAGVTVVATSNVHPDNLYQHGLSREYFLKFIDLLKAKVDVVELQTSLDYRLEKAGCGDVYFTPLNHQTKSAMDEKWSQLTAGAESRDTHLSVQGRTIPVPLSSGTMARFDFADLCQQPLGANDYLALAAKFGFLFIDCIPVLMPEQRNETKRFINLIDTLYDNHVKLIASAAAAPEMLYQATSGTESFEFKRTVSRLVEMQSLDYLKADRWQRRAA